MKDSLPEKVMNCCTNLMAYFTQEKLLEAMEDTNGYVLEQLLYLAGCSFFQNQGRCVSAAMRLIIEFTPFHFDLQIFAYFQDCYFIST